MRIKGFHARLQQGEVTKMSLIFLIDSLAVLLDYANTSGTTANTTLPEWMMRSRGHALNAGSMSGTGR